MVVIKVTIAYFGSKMISSTQKLNKLNKKYWL